MIFRVAGISSSLRVFVYPTVYCKGCDDPRAPSPLFKPLRGLSEARRRVSRFRCTRDSSGRQWTTRLHHIFHHPPSLFTCYRRFDQQIFLYITGFPIVVLPCLSAWVISWDCIFGGSVCSSFPVLVPFRVHLLGRFPATAGVALFATLNQPSLLAQYFELPLRT